MSITFCRIHGETGIVSRYTKYGIIFTLLQCGCKRKEKKFKTEASKGSEDVLDFLKPKEVKEDVTFSKDIADNLEKQVEEVAGERSSREAEELEEFVNEVTEESLKGQTAYPYQADGVLFCERANGRALILDEMGLGKTIQALLYLRRSRTYPCVIFCKPSLTQNWMKECLNWVGIEHIPWIITSGKIPPGMGIYICSIDMAFKKRDEISQLGIKLIIIDELQNMKNMEAKRTFAIRNIASIGNGEGEQVEHIIGLTGTPIKNRATEFFPALNMVRPDLFPSEADFIHRWTRVVWIKDESKRQGGTYKEGGIRDLADFKKYTEDFVIRRLRADVLPDLPSVARHNRFVDMSQKNKEVYAKMHMKLEKFMLEKEGEIRFQDYSTILSYISNMRQITALAKVEFAVEYIEEFLESSDSKITVFTHHHLAIDYLVKLLNEKKIPYLRYRSKDDYDQIEKFNKPGGPRPLLASTQSAGEGLNLQYQCHHCIFMERQWNPAIEEQAEGRFTRIGSEAEKVDATYLIALGTIDEWMTELIEFKRVSANVEKEGEYFKDQTTLQIAQTLIKKGLPKWRLPRM